MFIHIREPKEIQKVVDCYDVLTLLIKRKDYETIKSNEADANVENYNYDFIFENDTLEKLEETAKDFVDKLVRE